MFIGHFGVAFASKRIAPRVSLGWLFAACQFPDLIWPILVLAGIERVRVEPGNTAFTPLAFDHYPWSHSLLTVMLWGVALGAACFMARRDKRGAVVVGLLVVSHWVLDWITHQPDLPLLPTGETRVGLGLWNNVPATIGIETLMYLGAVGLYSRMTTGEDRVGRLGYWVLVVFLFTTYVANMLSPPPPTPTAVAASTLALWVLVPISAWVDRHRRLQSGHK